MHEQSTTDVVVVGGGLAGLSAATYLARGGRRVTLFEQARDLGGRAQTRVEHEHYFNVGPHALYQASAGAQVLRELGVHYSGGVPGNDHAFVVRDGRLYPFPASPLSLLTSALLGPRDKLALARLLASISRTDPAPLNDVTLRAWLEQVAPALAVRQVLGTALRVATYSHDPDRQSAGAALAQLQTALKAGVLYLDGGWQTLVTGLRRAAETAGVQIVTHKRVTSVVRDGAVRGVRLADGTTWAAATVLVSASPAVARALVADGPPTALDRWAAAAIPVRAATLDVALRRLPSPRHLVALGLNRPTYLSVHSAVARLAPAGGATIHVAEYIGDGQGVDAAAVERELEGLLDLAQPGWRDVLVTRHFLPHITVSNALAAASLGGTAGRPEPAVPDVPGLYVAGDWVGPEGMLADASFASARRAAHLILAAGRQHSAPAVTEPASLAATA